MSTKWRLTIAFVVVAGVIGVLIRTAVIHASTYYVTVAQLYQEEPDVVNQPTTVSGNIVGKSVQWNPEESLLKFSMVDKPGGRAVAVVFHGARPDDFTNNWPVIVTGKLTKAGVFQATQLLIKCPSKYQASTSPAVVTATPTSN